MTTGSITGQQREQRRSALTEQLQRAYLGGLWQPRKRLDPLVFHKWEWKDIWACLHEAGEIVDVDENSPMRTIQLVNPSLEELKATSRTIQVSVQLLKTGELAQAHRHTQPQPRFIVEADGAYTTVSGEQIFMRDRDFIVTPGWDWHDHTNPSPNQAVWLDIHDPHLAGHVGAMFNERFGENGVQPITKPEGYHLRRASMLRAKTFSEARGSTPMKYPWADTLSALKDMAASGEADPHDGVAIEYRSPVDGGPAMPTIGCHVQMLRPGEETRPLRRTETVVYHVVEGEGAIALGAEAAETITWEERDCFIVPPWEWRQFSNTSRNSAYLFSVTDAPAVRALGFYKEELGR